MTETIKIKHPSHGKDGAFGETTKAAFNELWEAKGWVIVEDESVQDSKEKKGAK